MLVSDGGGWYRAPAPQKKKVQPQEQQQAKVHFQKATDDARRKTNKFRNEAQHGASHKKLEKLRSEASAAWNQALGTLPNYLRLVGMSAEAGKEKRAIDQEIARLKNSFKGSDQDRKVFNDVVGIGGKAVSGETRGQMDAELDLTAKGEAFDKLQNDYSKAVADYNDAVSLPPQLRHANPEIVPGAEKALHQAEAALNQGATDLINADVDAHLHRLFGDGKDCTYTGAEYRKAGAGVKADFKATGQLALLIDGIAIGRSQKSGDPANVAVTLNQQIEDEAKRQFHGDGKTYTPEQWHKAGEKVKALYAGPDSGQVPGIVDTLVLGKVYEPKTREYNDKIIKGDVSDLHLSTEEAALGKENPEFLATLLATGKRFDGSTLSPEMTGLAKSNPAAFTILMTSGVSIAHSTGGGREVPTIETSDGKFRYLTPEETNIFTSGGEAGARDLADCLASQLTGARAGDPLAEGPQWSPVPGASEGAGRFGRSVPISGTQGNVAPLTQARRMSALSAGDLIRVETVTEEMQRRMTAPNPDEIGALKYLKENMDNVFSGLTGEILWQQAGAPYFTPQWAEQKVASFQGDADANGKWMQDVFGAGPASIVPIVFGAEKAKFPVTAYKTNTNLKEFWSGLSDGILLVDPSDGAKPNTEAAKSAAALANDMTGWLTNAAGGGLIRTLRSTDGFAFNPTIRASVGEGHGSVLASSLQNKMLAGDFEDFAQEFGTTLPDEIKNGRTEIQKRQNKEKYADFKTNKKEIVEKYFDSFLGNDLLKTPLKLSEADTPRFRNAVGTALSLTPNQNMDKAAMGDTSVDWYARDSREWKIIVEVLIPWFKDQGGPNSTVQPVPTIYASPRDGIKYSALFRTSPSAEPGTLSYNPLDTIDAVETAFQGDKQVDPMIDGQAAIDTVDMALGDLSTAQDDKKIAAHQGTNDKRVDPFDLSFNWHYSNFTDFQNKSANDDNGQIYIPKNMEIADRDGDGHVDWVERDAARISAREWAEFGGDVVAAAAGVAAMAVTGGMAAPLIIGAMAWGGSRLFNQASDMIEHGQSLSWSNPNARMLYANTALLGLGASSMVLRSASEVLTAAGAFRSVAVFTGRAATVTGGLAMAGGAGSTVYQLGDVIENHENMSSGELLQAATNTALGLTDFAGGKHGRTGSNATPVKMRNVGTDIEPIASASDRPSSGDNWGFVGDADPDGEPHGEGGDGFATEPSPDDATVAPDDAVAPGDPRSPEPDQDPVPVSTMPRGKWVHPWSDGPPAQPSGATQAVLVDGSHTAEKDSPSQSVVRNSVGGEGTPFDENDSDGGGSDSNPGSRAAGGGAKPPVPPVPGDRLPGEAGGGDDWPTALDSLIHMVGRVYSIGKRQDHNAEPPAPWDDPVIKAIAQYNARPASDVLPDGDWVFLNQILGITFDRPEGSTMTSSKAKFTLPGRYDGLDPLETAIEAGATQDAYLNEMAREGEYTPRDAVADTFYFYPDDGEAQPATHSVYLNVNLNYLAAVGEFVVRSLLDKPGRFADIVRVRIKGPIKATADRNNVIIDVASYESIDPIIEELLRYQAENPTHFDTEVQEMTQARGPGISVVQQPTPGMNDNFLRVVSGLGIPLPGSLEDFPGVMRTVAVRMAWADSVLHGERAADLLNYFNRSVRVWLRQFGIDPTQPWKNLYEEGSATGRRAAPQPPGPRTGPRKGLSGWDGARLNVHDTNQYPPIKLPPKAGGGTQGGEPTPGQASSSRVRPLSFRNAGADEVSMADAAPSQPLASAVVDAPDATQASARPGRGWSATRVQDPATGEVIDVRVPARSADRAARMADDDGVIGPANILTLGDRQTELTSERPPTWVLVHGDDGPTLYPLQRVGVLGKRGLAGLDKATARKVVHAVREIYRQWLARIGVNAVRLHGNLVVLAAAGIPLVALAGEHGQIVAMAGIFPTGVTKALNKFKGSGFGGRIVNAATDKAKVIRGKVSTARREILYYAVTVAGAPWIAIPLAMTAKGTHLDVFGQSIPVPDPRHLSPVTLRVESYVDLILRALPLAAVAFTAASVKMRARWGGTKLRGMSLRLINGITFTQNGLLALGALYVGTPHSVLGKISVVGFGIGQLSLGIRGMIGVRQSKTYGSFAASATRNPGRIKTIGPDVSQKGRKFEDVALVEGVDPLAVAARNTKFNFTASHHVGPGEDWGTVEHATGYSEASLKLFNPHLGTALSPGDRVDYPTPQQARRLLREGLWKLVPGGRRVRNKTVDIQAAGMTPGTPGTEVKGTRGQPWKRFARENGTSDVPLLLLNRDAQLQASGRANPPLQFSRSTRVQKGQTWVDMAEHFGTSIERLREFHPELNRELQENDTVSYPTRQEIAALREDMGPFVLTESIEIPVYGEAKLENMQGQTWKSAEKQTGVPVYVLQIANGKHLYLAGKKAGIYKVRKGEDWPKVANNLGVPEATLKALNAGAQGQALTKGQDINTPTKVEIPAEATWSWIEKTIRMHGASRGKSIALTQTLGSGVLHVAGLTGHKLGYMVELGGETWTGVAAKFGFAEAALKNENARLAKGNPIDIPEHTQLKIPLGEMQIPADADVTWVQRTVAALGGNFEESMRLTDEEAKTIRSNNTRVPAYSFEADSQRSRWMSIVGSAGVATGSGTIFHVDVQRWAVSKPVQVALEILNGGNGVAATVNAGILATPDRAAGNVSKKNAKFLASTQTMAGWTLGGRALVRLSALAGWLGSKIQGIARNNP